MLLLLLNGVFQLLLLVMDLLLLLSLRNLGGLLLNNLRLEGLHLLGMLESISFHEVHLRLVTHAYAAAHPANSSGMWKACRAVQRSRHEAVCPRRHLVVYAEDLTGEN
jgi:hypothetical protein